MQKGGKISRRQQVAVEKSACKALKIGKPLLALPEFRRFTAMSEYGVVIVFGALVTMP